MKIIFKNTEKTLQAIGNFYAAVYKTEIQEKETELINFFTEKGYSANDIKTHLEAEFKNFGYGDFTGTISVYAENSHGLERSIEVVYFRSSYISNGYAKERNQLGIDYLETVKAEKAAADKEKEEQKRMAAEKEFIEKALKEAQDDAFEEFTEKWLNEKGSEMLKLRKVLGYNVDDLFPQEYIQGVFADEMWASEFKNADTSDFEKVTRPSLELMKAQKEFCVKYEVEKFRGIYKDGGAYYFDFNLKNPFGSWKMNVVVRIK